MTAIDQLKEILDPRVEEPMIPPRALSFTFARGRSTLGLPPGLARLRPRKRHALLNGTARAG